MATFQQGSSRLSNAQATQKVGISGTAASATAFGAQTYQVRLVADTLCFITIGGAAATTSSTPLPANWPEYFTVTPGQTISVIGTGGNLYVSEMA